MAIDVEKIGEGTGEVSGAFSHSEIYLAFLEDFDAMTEPSERDGTGAAANLEDLVSIATPHTFVTGKGFTKIRAIADSVGLETNQIGDPTMSPVQENKLTVKILGSKPELLGWKRLLKGRDVVVLATEFGSGQVRQLGSAKYGARLLEAGSKIEPLPEGENATTLVFGDKQKYDAPIYSGTITEQPSA